MISFLNNLFRRKYKVFTIDSYFELSEEEKNNVCQKLNPYEPSEWEVFKEVERRFTNKYGQLESVDSIFCGLASSLGPFNAINVTIKKGSKRTFLPKKYEGFPVLKIYESQKRKFN